MSGYLNNFLFIVSTTAHCISKQISQSDYNPCLRSRSIRACLLGKSFFYISAISQNAQAPTYMRHKKMLHRIIHSNSSCITQAATSVRRKFCARLMMTSRLVFRLHKESRSLPPARNIVGSGNENRLARACKIPWLL